MTPPSTRARAHTILEKDRDGQLLAPQALDQEGSPAAGAAGGNAWNLIEPLYRGSFDKLCRYVQNKSGAGRSDAEDVVQDAFMKLAQRIERVADPKAYLDRAVETGIVDWSRREIPTKVDDEMLMVNPPVPYSFEQAQMRDRIIRFLTGLTEREKEAVALVIFAGYSTAEAGSILGISRQAVEQLIRAGVRRAR